MRFSHYQSTANPTPNTRDKSYSSRRQAILRCRRTVWTKKSYFYTHLDILSLRKQPSLLALCIWDASPLKTSARPQRQKFHTDDPQSVRNLVNSYSYCYSIAIVYEPATDKRQTVTTVKCKRDKSTTKKNSEEAFEFC